MKHLNTNKVKSRVLSTVLAAIMLTGQIVSPTGSILAVGMDYAESGIILVDSEESESPVIMTDGDTVDTGEISDSGATVVDLVPSSEEAQAGNDSDIASSVDLSETDLSETDTDTAVIDIGSESDKQTEEQNLTSDIALSEDNPAEHSEIDLTDESEQNSDTADKNTQEDTRKEQEDIELSDSRDNEPSDAKEDDKDISSEEKTELTDIDTEKQQEESLTDKKEENLVNKNESETEEEISGDISLVEDTDINDIRASYFQNEIADATLDDMDFSTMRLVVAAADDAIVDKENIMSGYNGVYLMQYLTEEQTKRAYMYYSKHADMVSPDLEISMASSENSEEVMTETTEISGEEPDKDLTAKSDSDESDNQNNDKPETDISGEQNITGENEIPDIITGDESITAEDGLSSDENPLNELAKQIETDAGNQETNEIVLEEEKPLIALIDTGASANKNIVSRVSMLGDAVEDDNGHGDRMVGYILEEDPEARILSIKALDANGKGTVSSVYAAMEYAITQGAGIINLSMSAYSTEENAILSEIVNRAVENGTTVVGAAGNNRADVKYFVPGNIEKATIIGSVDKDGKLQTLSNFGDVDYYVVSDVTSEAAARYSGMLSAGNTDDNERIFDKEFQNVTNKIDDNVIDDESGIFDASAIINDYVWQHDSESSVLWLNINYGALSSTDLSVKIKFGEGAETVYPVERLSSNNTQDGRTMNARVILADTYSNWQKATNVDLIKTEDASKQATVQTGLYPEFTVVYNGNGGTTPENKISYGNMKAGTLPESERTGYTFTGWRTSATGGTQLTTTTKITSANETKTYYAHWTPITYSVKYNGNGSTRGSMSNSSHTYDSEKNLAGNEFIKTGYVFKEWNTKADGTGTAYANSASVKNLSATNNAIVNLYAQWTPISYKVKYNGNGFTGGSMSDSSHVYDTAKNLTANTFTRTGHTFKEWNTKADGTGTAYADNASVENLVTVNGGSITLYARWTPDTYTVVYDANGGTGAPESQTKTYGVNLTLSSTEPAKTSKSTTYTVTFNQNNGTSTGAPNNKLTATSTKTYAFSEWNTKADGSGVSFLSGGAYTINAASTLYAQYSESTANGSITLPTPARTGYTCDGWYTEPKNGIKVGNPGDSYTVSENQTLYAHWTANAAAIAPVTQSAGLSIVRASQGKWTADITTDFTTLASEGFVLVTVSFRNESLRIHYQNGVRMVCVSARGTGIVYKWPDGSLHTSTTTGSSAYHPDGIDTYTYDQYPLRYTFVADPTYLGYSMTDLTKANTTGATARTNYTTDLVNAAKAASQATIGSALNATSLFWGMYDMLTYHGNGSGVSNVPSINTAHLQPALANAGDTSCVASVTVSTQVPTRSGYTFLNWNTKADGTGTTYNPGDSFSTYHPDNGAHLYAQWSKNDGVENGTRTGNLTVLTDTNNKYPAVVDFDFTSHDEGVFIYINWPTLAVNKLKGSYQDLACAIEVGSLRKDGTGYVTGDGGSLYVPSGVALLFPSDTDMSCNFMCDPNTFGYTLEQLRANTTAGEAARSAYMDAWINKATEDTTNSATLGTGTVTKVAAFIKDIVRYYSNAYNPNGEVDNTLTNMPSTQSSVYLNPLRSGHTGPLAVSDLVPQRDNYNFIGWNTERDGSGTMYQPGDTYSTYLTEHGLPLYGQWEPKTVLAYQRHQAFVPAGAGNDSGYPNSNLFTLNSSLGNNGVNNSQMHENLDSNVYDVHKLSSSAQQDMHLSIGENVVLDPSWRMECPNGYEPYPYARVGYTGNVNNVYFGDTFEISSLTDYALGFYYRPINYSITYNMSEGGENNASNPTGYSVINPATFHAPTREGYQFMGWRDQNGNVFQEGDGINTGSDPNYTNTFTNGENFYEKMAARRTGDVVLTPIWKKLNTGDFVDEDTNLLPLLEETEKNEGKFKIVEIKQTPGYILDGNNPPTQNVNVLTATLEDGVIVATFDNQPNEFIIKKQDSSGNALAGAEFRIWNDTGEVRTAITSDGSGTVPLGEIHVKRVSPGDWHYLETQAPAGYQIDSTTYTVHVKPDGTVDGGNTRPPVIDTEKGEFIIRKTDESGNPMAGVTFAIGGIPGITSKTTDTNGCILLTGLTEGTYTYQETALPSGTDGYIIDNTQYVFHVLPDGAVEIENNGETVVSSTATVVNRRNRLTIIKQDTNGNQLNGAVIEIRKDGAAYTTVTIGQTELSALADGTYTYKETTAPAGYLSDSEWHTLCTVSNGKIDGLETKTIAIQNPENQIILQKNDENNNGIGNAVIHISGPNGYELDVTTNSSGQAKVNRLAPGTYTFKETKAPQGYSLSASAKGSFVVNTLGQVSYTYEQGTAMKNTPNALKIRKIDNNNAPLANVSFTFTYTGNATSPFNGPLTTNASGEINLTKLPEGAYTFVESAVPNGFVLDTTTHRFSVNRDGRVVPDESEVSITESGNIIIQITNHRQALLNVSVSKRSSDPSDTGELVAGFELRDAATNQKIECPVTSSGSTKTFKDIPISATETKTYKLVETNAPAGYVGGWEETFTVEPAVDKTVTLSFTAVNDPNELILTKKDADTNELLKDAVFELKQGSTTVGEYTTGENGQIKIRKLHPGTYTLSEKTAPAGYVNSHANWTVVVSDDGLIKIGSATPAARASVSATNEKMEPNRITLTKTDANSGAVIPGATFELRKEGISIATLITNAAGQLSYEGLAEGSYSIVEIAPAKGYFNDAAAINFTVDAAGNIVSGGNSAREKTFTATNTKNEPKSNKLTLRKTDTATSEAMPGIAFVLSRGTSQVGTYFTDENGELVIEKLAEGSYTLTESEVPEGYMGTPASVSFVVGSDGKISVNGGTASLEATANVTNTPQNHNKITLQKHKTGDTSVKIAGAKFNIEKDSSVIATVSTDENGSFEMNDLQPGAYTITETAAASGYVNDAAPVSFTVRPDMFIVYNSETPALEKTFTVTNSEVVPVHNSLTLNKKDSLTSANLVGVEFELRVSDTENVVETAYTDAEGNFVIRDIPEGNYKLVETRPLEGYRNDNITIDVTVAADGKITLSTGGTAENDRTVNVTNTPVNHNKITLLKHKTGDAAVLIAGAMFSIKKGGTEIAQRSTGENGTFELTDIEPGTYTITETQPADGYANDAETITFTVRDDMYIVYNSETPVLEKTFTVTNTETPQVHNTLTLNKKDGATSEVIPGAKFELRQGATVVDTYSTDTEGNLFVEDMPEGTYTLVETNPAEGYNNDNVTVNFSIDSEGKIHIGSETPAFTKTVNATNTKTPEPNHNKVTLVKTNNVTDANVVGAEFQLKKNGEVILNAGTDENGKIEIADLEPGNYELLESVPATGYIEDHISFSFVVNENRYIVYNSETPVLEKTFTATNTPDMTVEQDPEPNKFTLYKTDADHGDPVPGVTFELRSGANVVETFVTDAAGSFTYENLDPGNYTLVETIPAAGFNNDNINIAFTVDAYGRFVYQTETPVFEKEFRVTNTRPNGIDIYKTDADDAETKVAGVQFELKRGDTVIATLTTDENGHAGYNNIPEGEYVLRESAPAEGYRDEGLVFNFRVGNDNKLYKEGETTGVNRLRFEAENTLDTPDPHPVKITKKDPNNNPLPGAVFTLYKWNGTEYIEDTENLFIDNGDGTYELSQDISWTAETLGKYRIIETKAPGGYHADWQQDITIPKDADRGKEIEEKTFNYAVTNVPATLTVRKITNPAGSAVGTTFEFGPASNEEETDEKNPYRVTERYTIESGNTLVFTPIYDGIYTLREVSAPDGYLLDSTPHTITVQNGEIYADTDTAGKSANYEFEQTNNANSLVVTKVDIKTNQPLAGATFTLTSTDTEHPYTASVVTVADGTATFRNIPSGTYTLKETAAPDGYFTDDSEYMIQVDKVTHVAEYTHLENELEVTSSEFRSRDYENETGPCRIEIDKQSQTGAHLEGAVFGIWEYSAETETYVGGPDEPDGFMDPEDFVDEASDIGIDIPTPTEPIPLFRQTPKYTMTYSDGLYVADLNVTADNKGMFLVRELKAPNGYYGTWEQEVNVLDYDNKTASFTTGKLGPVINEPAQFVIQKENEEGEVLEGAVFKVWNDIDGEDNAVTYTTGQDGTVTVPNIRNSTTYHLKETKAPHGYGKVKGTIDVEVDAYGGVNGTNNAVLVVTNPVLKTRKLIVNCIIDEKYSEYEDISFMYDIHGVLDEGETVDFKLLLTPNGAITSAQANKYVTELTTTKSKIATGALLTLPPGTYTVTQRKPQRYDLVEVFGETENADVVGLTSVCDLDEYDKAECTFINVLNRWNMASSAAAATNHAGPEYEDPTA